MAKGVGTEIIWADPSLLTPRWIRSLRGDDVDNFGFLAAERYLEKVP